MLNLPFGVDTETTGVDRYHGSKPFYVVACDSDHELTSWITDVDPFTREPQWTDEDLGSMREYLLRPVPRRVAHNMKFDVSMLDAIIEGLADKWDWEASLCTLTSSHLVRSDWKHDLTSQVMTHLDHDLRPVEDALEKAVKAARSTCRRKDFVARHGKWRIAKEGEPDMPSVKPNRTDQDKVWHSDMWLPRAVAKAEWELTGDPQWAPETHPWWTVLPKYSNPDAECLLPLANAHEKLVRHRKQWPILVMRMQYLASIARMERRGVTLSESRLAELEERFTAKSESAGKICVNIAASYGKELVLPKNGMNGSLSEFAFGEGGLELRSEFKTDSGNPSLNKDALEHFGLTLPERSRELTFVKQLSSKRGADTHLGFAAAYRRYWIDTMIDDIKVVYSKVNPTGTHTLRGSSKDPNSQQVSKKKEFNLRYAFGPRPGREWWSIDYDNLELRIAAYESGERAMIDIFEKPDEAPYFGSYHLLIASILYPDVFWPLADQPGEFKKRYESTYYKWVKNFNFADQYGAVLGSGTADLAAHLPGAQAMISSASRCGEILFGSRRSLSFFSIAFSRNEMTPCAR